MKFMLLISILVFSVTSFAKNEGGPIMGYVAADEPYNGDAFVVSCQDESGNIVKLPADARKTSASAQRFENPNNSLIAGNMKCTLDDITKSKSWDISFELAFAQPASWIKHTSSGNFLMVRVWVSEDQKTTNVFAYNYNRQ